MSIAEWREMPKERPTRTVETRQTEVTITRYNGVEYAMSWLAWSEWRDHQILALRDRLRDTAKALDNLAPYLQLYNEPTYSDLVLRSPGDALRKAAEEADKRESAIRKARAILKRLKEEGLA